MAEQLELVRVFLASPGDVRAERDHARQVIDETNRTIARHIGVRVEVISWDTDAYPAFGADPQTHINNQIADMSKYDLFVGIFWNRLGTATPRSGSGTEEEFRLAADALRRAGKPQIMLYFSQAPASFTMRGELEQKQRLLNFREEVRRGGLIQDYSGPEEFHRLFREGFQRWLSKEVAPNSQSQLVSQSAQNHTASPPAGLPTTVEKWVLLANHFFRCNSVVESRDGSIALRLQEPDPEGEAVLRTFQSRHSWGRELESFAYGNNGGVALVKTVERREKDGRVEWIVSVKLETKRPDAMTEMAFNGISADQIAVKRARLLLLSEEPESLERIVGGDVLRCFVEGVNAPVKVTHGVFPDLWTRFSGNPARFVQYARLVAIFVLKASMTVEHILELNVGPIEGGSVAVRFRGRRYQIFTNKTGYTIEVVGRCPLGQSH